MDLEITKVPIIQITKGSSVIEVPSSNNEIGIASGTLRLKRSIVDTDIAFGEPIASEFSVELFNIEEDLQGCPIQVFLEDRSATPYTRTAIFTGVIDSSKTDNIGHTRQIVAYDWIYYHRNDNMADWWNNYWEPATGYSVKGVRDDFLEYLGFTAPTREYVNDYNTHISWSEADLPIVTTITFAQIIRMFCEIQGTFPYIDGSGNLDFAVLDNSVTTDLRGEYESYNSNWEDFVTDTITGIAVYSSSEDLLTMVGTDDNVYNIAGNIWLMHLEEYYHENVVETLTRLLGVISNIQYKPCQLKMIKAHNGLVLGQRVQTDKGYTYVMSEELYGVCFVEQTIEAKASASTLSGEVNNINDTMVQGNKLSRVEKTIDGLTSEVSAISTDLQNNHYTKTETDSKISQSATSILTTVSETYTTKSNAIKTDTLHYLATSAGSGVTKDTPGWTTTVQSVTSTNKYLWTYHTYTYADDTQSTPHTSDTTPVITGVYGDRGQQGQQGPQGTTGTGVSSVTPLYYAGSSTPSKPTSAVTSTSTSGGQWTKAIPSLSNTYPNLYTCDQVYYTNGTYSWSDVVSDINSTTSYSEINQLKNKIVLKVDNNGKIVQVALSADASTGSTFNINADFIKFVANKTLDLQTANIAVTANNFTIDDSGNVTLTGTIHANAGDIAGWTIGTNKLYKTYTLLDSNQEYEVALISQYANAQIYSQQTDTNRNYSQRASLKNGSVYIECSIGSTHDTYNSLVFIGASRTGTAQETTQANGSVSIRHTDDTKPYMWLENNHLSIMSKTDDVYYPNAVVSNSGIYYQKPDYDTTVMMNADGLLLPYLGDSARNKILLVSTASTSNKVGVSPVSADELECLLGVTSNIQGQLTINTKTDSTPYLERHRTDIVIGDREYLDKVIGGTVAWNQQVFNGNFVTADGGWRTQQGSLSIANNKATLTCTGAAWNQDILPTVNILFKANHLYYFHYGLQGTSGLDGVSLTMYVAGSWAKGAMTITPTRTVQEFFYVRSSDAYFTRFVLSGNASGYAGESYSIDSFYIVDLTEMFGSTIADYVRGLGESNGIAWLRSYGFLTKEYYPYTTGELVSTKPSAHKMTLLGSIIGNYPFANVELRGNIVLQNNELVFNGDEYASDGTVTRVAWIVNGLSSLTRSSAKSFWFPPPYKGRNGGWTLHTLSDLVTSTAIDWQGNIFIYTVNEYDSWQAAKAALQNIVIVYQLGTPRTETVIPYTNPQICERRCYEEFVDTRDVPMPAGHSTEYIDIPSWMVNRYFNDLREVPYEIASSQIYSTAERRIGTWIDGKPIYQKTFTGTVTSTSSARTYIVIEDLSSYNIKDYLGSEGIIKDGTVWKTLNVADTYNCSIAYDTNGKKLNVLIANWGQGESFDYIITIRYTKTS